MAEDNKTVFQIFMEGVGIYTTHFKTFLKYMTFPVLGQFAGIVLAFGLSLGYVFYFPQVLSLDQNAPTAQLSTTLLLTIPGLLIFTKAFWEYLLAYVSVSSMTENTVKSGRIYDIEAHKQVAQKRMGEFITLWMIFGIFSLIASLPPMWVFAAIIFVYILLVFQVFTFEKKLSAWDCFIQSKKLVQKNFLETVGMLMLVGGFTYIIIPKIVEFLLSLLMIGNLLAMALDPFIAQTLPIAQWNSALESLNLSYAITSLSIANMICSGIISTIVIGYTLPLRSICWTLWYKYLKIKELNEKAAAKKKAKSENV